MDPLIFIRDASFYAISLVCLFYALRFRGEVDYDDADHLFIRKLDSWIFLVWYVVYVALCANYEWILQKCRIKRETDDEISFNYEAFDGETRKQISLNRVSSKIPFVRSCVEQEPAGNFHTEPDKPNTPTEVDKSQVNIDFQKTSSTVTELYVAESSSQENYFCASNITKKYFVSDKTEALDIHGIDDIEAQEDGSVCLHLWQRSTFYDMAKIDMNAWQLRWFTFTGDGISSVMDREEMDYSTSISGTSYIPHYNKFETDEARLLIKVKAELRDCKYKYCTGISTFFFALSDQSSFLISIRQSRQ